MVEKVSDWVSQDGVLEEELLWNIVSTVNINVEPNVSCWLEAAHNNVAATQACSRVTNQSRMKQPTERAASCSSMSKSGRERKVRGILLCSIDWSNVGADLRPLGCY